MLSLLFCASVAYGKERIQLVKDGVDQYVISADQQNASLSHAAAVINDYTKQSTGTSFDFKASDQSKPAIVLEQVPIDNVYPEDSYSIQFSQNNLYIKGSGRGVIYAAYRYVREILGGRKWYAGKENTSIPKLQTVSVDADFHLFAKPRFAYREIYFPVELDQSYLDWYGLHNLEEKWGDWGHTFNKILPPEKFFKIHPEYYSLYHGRRQPTQLCLSNEAVFEHTVRYFKERMRENPLATYWSIAANDDLGSCTCNRCQAVDKQEGGAQGSLIRFVNKVAAVFPNKKFTTLAYLETANAPAHLRVADNVTVILSNIDAFRRYDLANEPSAAVFRKQLRDWKAKSAHVFVWDYLTQFTNYLAPFPIEGTLQDNLTYLKHAGVEGLFLQGGGASYTDIAELNTYLLAHLVWDTDISADMLIKEFVQGYYGKAGLLVYEYLQARRKALPPAASALSIYGNPIDNRGDFLSPAAMDHYSNLLAKAEVLVEGDTLLEQRIRRIGLSLDYTYLQQARFYGPRQHGIFQQIDGQWVVRPVVRRKVQQFVEDAKKLGVLELSEGGATPDQYRDEWEDIFAAGLRLNKASAAQMKIQNPFDPSFPANGIKTLTDSVSGYSDYSYNWLLWTGESMDIAFEFKQGSKIGVVELNFLQDPRHWIFPPEEVRISISVDGQNEEEVLLQRTETLDEDYTVQKVKFSTAIDRDVKVVHIVAKPFQHLPEWRYHPRRKVSMACDEIWLE